MLAIGLHTFTRRRTGRRRAKTDGGGEGHAPPAPGSTSLRGGSRGAMGRDAGTDGWPPTLCPQRRPREQLGVTPRRRAAASQAVSVPPHGNREPNQTTSSRLPLPQVFCCSWHWRQEEELREPHGNGCERVFPCQDHPDLPSWRAAGALARAAEALPWPVPAPVPTRVPGTSALPLQLIKFHESNSLLRQDIHSAVTEMEGSPLLVLVSGLPRSDPTEHPLSLHRTTDETNA